MKYVLAVIPVGLGKSAIYQLKVLFGVGSTANATSKTTKGHARRTNITFLVLKLT